jgi:hypothetical protein
MDSVENSKLDVSERITNAHPNKSTIRPPFVRLAT